MGEVKMFPNSNEPRSIQGEQQQVIAETLWASDEDTAEWINKADDGWIICKQRSRHGYQRAKRGDRLQFTGKTKSGYYVRRVLCPDCKAVELVELWIFKPKRGTQNIIGAAELVGAYPNYLDRSYLAAPGTGRMKTSKIRQLIVTDAMTGVDLREIEKEIAAYEAERRRADAERMEATAS
jgi:hypothetical protein